MRASSALYLWLVAQPPQSSTSRAATSLRNSPGFWQDYGSGTGGTKAREIEPLQRLMKKDVTLYAHANQRIDRTKAAKSSSTYLRIR